ncbi:MAG: hypothetical protein JRK53_07270 [Deltaproteobacteria bacterium]|nr:hypothetical protein [Deltaproteobacteria bacterium]MBW1819292.1 hypothetical protein [Deltaproteobacteria bacterium]
MFSAGCVRRGFEGFSIYEYLRQNNWKFTRYIGAADLIVILTCAAINENEDRSFKTFGSRG